MLRRSPRKPDHPKKRDEKLPPKHPEIVVKLFDKVKKDRRLTYRPERFLQELMAHIVVEPSAKMGLGNLHSLAVAIDGAPYRPGHLRTGNVSATVTLHRTLAVSVNAPSKDAAANRVGMATTSSIFTVIHSTIPLRPTATLTCPLMCGWLLVTTESPVSCRWWK